MAAPNPCRQNGTFNDMVAPYALESVLPFLCDRNELTDELIDWSSAPTSSSSDIAGHRSEQPFGEWRLLVATERGRQDHMQWGTAYCELPGNDGADGMAEAFSGSKHR